MKPENIKRITKHGFVVPKNTEPGKRWYWLAQVINKNRYTIGAEVGCNTGLTTGHLLRACPKLKKIIAVDLWAPVPDEVGGGTQYKDWDFPVQRRRFARQVRGNEKRLYVLQGISWEVTKEIDDNSLDFVFIDADHEYQSVINDIKAWTPKLKSGGMMSGHDTHFPDVMKAINELIPSWEAAGIDQCWFATKERVLL